MRRTIKGSRLVPLSHPAVLERWLALVLMSSWRYMISSLRENSVPGISILQEKTVWSDRVLVGTVEFTTTSYIRPRLTVVVVTGDFVGLHIMTS